MPTVWILPGILLFTAVFDVNAQSALGTSPTAKMPTLMVVKPNGLKFPAGQFSLEKTVEMNDRSLTADEYLRAKGLETTNDNLDAFKKMNPGVSADGDIPIGTRMLIFKPKFDTMTLDAGDAATLNLKQAAMLDASREVFSARQVSMRVATLPDSIFKTSMVKTSLKSAVSDLQTAASLVEQRAGTLPASDLALARVQLALASADVDEINKKASSKSLSESDLTSVNQSVAELKLMNASLSSGQRPFKHRKVTVSVTAAPGVALGALRVYALPAGVVDRPSTFPIETIKSLLADLTFEVAPSEGTVPEGNFRLWVGRDFRYDRMAALVATGSHSGMPSLCKASRPMR